jgi:Abnormal spindle-like microcephaly-assoc'd, ASPM-SPD-2-Hydin
MSSQTQLNQYDVLMLPCEGGQYIRPAAQLANIIEYANAGGRVYTSHYGYVWMYNNPPFNGVANWDVNQSALADGLATVDTTFTDGQTMSNWLQLIGASTSPGQIEVMTTKHDQDGVIAPTQSWLTLNDSAHRNPVMQFTFNTPIAAPNQCGRVLYNEYHVENTGVASGLAFPKECSTGAMTPQEKLLEYSLFDLTNNGGGPTMAPVSADFGSEAVGFTSASKPFIWTNNSTFPLLVTAQTVTGDYVVTSPACGSVGPGATCEIDVAFKPTALGVRPGILSVVSASSTLTSTLTGTGIVALAGTPTTLAFGNVDVGTPSVKTITVTNNAAGPVPVPTLVVTGDYTAVSGCGATVAGNGTCTITVTFRPSVTGPRNGTLTVASNSVAYALTTTLTGNGVDFTLGLNPTSGSTVSGDPVSPQMAVSPIAGFSNTITVSCTTMTPASTCVPAKTSFVPTDTVTGAVTISTTSQYTVVGYSGMGRGWLAVFAVGGGWLLWRRRRGSAIVRVGLMMVMLAAGSLMVTGCSGKYPDKNNPYTTPGSYTYTLSATDGTLTHSVTYSLSVTAK